jgi:hypothetical protein
MYCCQKLNHCTKKQKKILKTHTTKEAQRIIKKTRRNKNGIEKRRRRKIFH